ncbi:piggyBac transposable element-derived protein 3-like [Diorhabda sublineata]|uniref:piggyBac transposable element-derived protein 3-like n=1 Tax=Diorhabda sublineata TaxID=1163346 RepID=UPI0024E0A4F6|nr:piggyBac transposable element-derived protein 3-like [Diorhabda sublineata]
MSYFSTIILQSHDLLNAFRKIGIRTTGTVHDNRIKKYPLVPVKSIKKREDRGVFDFQYDERNQLLFVRWNDNSAVTMAKNYDSVEPLAQVKRWSSKRKEKMPVPQPQLFKNYNYRMGGVDLLDQGVNNYRIAIHSKKWWWALFTHMLNVTVVNAWRLSELSTLMTKRIFCNMLEVLLVTTYDPIIRLYKEDLLDNYQEVF